jgi:hypothetical protein
VPAGFVPMPFAEQAYEHRDGRIEHMRYRLERAWETKPPAEPGERWWYSLVTIPPQGFDPPNYLLLSRTTLRS